MAPQPQTPIAPPQPTTTMLRYTGLYMPRRYTVCNEQGHALRSYVFGGAPGKNIQHVQNEDVPLFLKKKEDSIIGLHEKDKWQEMKQEETDIEALLDDILNLGESEPAEEPAKPNQPGRPATKPTDPAANK